MLERTPPQFRELQEISMQTDTRDILAHATRQSESHEDYFLVDMDAHVTETSFWPEILALLEPVDRRGVHRFTELARRAMDALGLDYQIVFPTPMLTLGMHPQDEIEAALGGAYNKWLVERILPEDDRLKGLLYLPFNTPEACVEQVEKYAHADGVIGFAVCSTRNKAVHHN